MAKDPPVFLLKSVWIPLGFFTRMSPDEELRTLLYRQIIPPSLSAAHQFSLANCDILNGVDKGPDLCILDLNPIAVAERQTVRGDVPSCVETPTSGN